MPASEVRLESCSVLDYDGARLPKAVKPVWDKQLT